MRKTFNHRTTKILTTTIKLKNGALKYPGWQIEQRKMENERKKRKNQNTNESIGNKKLK